VDEADEEDDEAIDLEALGIDLDALEKAGIDADALADALAAGDIDLEDLGLDDDNNDDDDDDDDDEKDEEEEVDVRLAVDNAVEVANDVDIDFAAFGTGRAE
jgi:ribonuclease E